MAEVTTKGPNQNNFLLFVKSKYILSEIMNNLPTIKLLNIIRYNKNLQNKLNKSLYDYENEFHKIVIEMITEEQQYTIFSFDSKLESSYH